MLYDKEAAIPKALSNRCKRLDATAGDKFIDFAAFEDVFSPNDFSKQAKV